MNKKDCLDLFYKYFHIKSYLSDLRNPDFELKSHIFYYRGIYKGIDALKILRVNAINNQNPIVFDIYYVSDEFEGLYKGYFKIKAESNLAEKIFKDVSKVCTDLAQYLFYVYKNSEFLKIYFASGNMENAVDHMKNGDSDELFQKIIKSSHMEISNYSMDDLENTLLRKEFINKYVTNFIKFNSKISEQTKIFFMNILSSSYENNIALINNRIFLKNYIHVNTKEVYFNDHRGISIYGLLDYAVKNHVILFLKLEFDFEGGGRIGKITG